MRAEYDPNSVYVSVWLDQTSDANNPAWIVSRDDYYGTDTIRVFPADSREAAIRFGRKVGRSHGFPVKIQD